MARAIILMLDSLGIGASDDAEHFGDVGADTFGHIAKARGPSFTIPHLQQMGLAAAAEASRGQWPGELPPISPTGAWGYAAERSAGKDTPSGHWELAGQPVDFDWGYFPDQKHTFPTELVEGLIQAGGLTGVLGNCHASGTTIIDQLGEEHIKSGQPIIYTSADSVFQIAAHEAYFGLDRLYRLCEEARHLCDRWSVGRVIARPFIGETRGAFRRTSHRRDYTTPPPSPTLLDHLVESGGRVISVGKVADIYAHRGISEILKGDDNQALFEATLEALDQAGPKNLVFTNFVDFDTHFGHRRDVMGYAQALEKLDLNLPALFRQLQPGDLVVATADHGCDPTWPGSDHTREHVPVLVSGPGVAPVALGRRSTFADIGQTLADHFNLDPLPHGASFYHQLFAGKRDHS